jgi:cellulose synthase operon protein C
MSEPDIHDQVGAFADGELDAAEAEAFRAHLADCGACQAELHELMQMSALPALAMSELEAARARRAPRRVWALVPAGLAVAAALVFYLRDDSPSKQPAAPMIALAPTRQLEGRLAWEGAAAHRPYAVQRAGAPVGEQTPLKVQAALEERGDRHGLGALAALAGDLDRARTLLDEAPASAAVDNDRALVALQAGDPETALRLTESALAKEPSLGAARWNRALALRDLGLPYAAAAELDAVAALGEPGWADEARQRSRDLLTADQAEADAAARVAAAGPQFAMTGEGLTAADVVAQPGLVRLHLYDAIRTAPDAAHVRALRPIAEALDAATGSQMAAHVDAIAARDFAVRGPLAKAYSDMMAGTPPPDAGKLVARMRKAGEIDLAIGTLLRASAGGAVTEAQLPELKSLAKASGDPWFELLAVEQDARLASVAGDPVRAEAVLGPALARCEREPVVYRCPRVAAAAAAVFISSQRLVEGRRALEAGWQLARRTGDRYAVDQLLLQWWANLAAVSDDVTALPLVRAYTDEMRLRRPDKCVRGAWGHELIAMLRINRVDFDGARDELAAAALACPPNDTTPRERSDVLQLAFTRASVLRRGGSADEVAALQADLAKLREGATPSELAMLDHVEGRLRIEREPAEGQALLARAIAEVTAITTDPLAQKARAYSLTLAVVDAGRRGDHRAALAWLADGATLPATCVVGAAVEDERRYAVVRGADGVDRGAYAADRTSPAIDASSLVPADLRASLQSCATISVLARPPIEGAPDLLPPELAWGYGIATAAPSTTDGTRLVVHDVEPPVWLGLPRLAQRKPPSGSISLAGAAATPTRVLAAMADASTIEIDAHGLVNAAVADASHLVLSPESDGRYALDVRAVRGARLRRSPVVVLAACHAATSAPFLHESWALPAAFVSAGARAVIASTDEIPDAEAAAFFDDVLERSRAVAPAQALRDARIAWKSSHPQASWLDRLVVFQH